MSRNKAHKDRAIWEKGYRSLNLFDSNVLNAGDWISHHLGRESRDIAYEEWPWISIGKNKTVYIAPWGEYLYQWRGLKDKE